MTTLSVNDHKKKIALPYYDIAAIEASLATAKDVMRTHPQMSVIADALTRLRAGVRSYEAQQIRKFMMRTRILNICIPVVGCLLVLGIAWWLKFLIR